MYYEIIDWLCNILTCCYFNTTAYTGNFLPQVAFSVSPQPILRLGESAQLICTTQYSMLHNAEIRDTSHNVTLVLKHDGVPLNLAAVVPSQLVSQTCYECVAKGHSGNLLAKEELCVEVVAKEGEPYMQQLYSLHSTHLYVAVSATYVPLTTSCIPDNPQLEEETVVHVCLLWD